MQRLDMNNDGEISEEEIYSVLAHLDNPTSPLKYNYETIHSGGSTMEKVTYV